MTMMQTADNLQYVFACLLTHSKWVKIIKANLDTISKHFDLSLQDIERLRKFLNHDEKKIWTTAVLAEEKRWRELLPTIRYTEKIIPTNSLKEHWHSYLDKFTLRQTIPKTPLNESIEFLTYLLNKKINLLANSIIEYEITRNSLLFYSFPKNYYSSLIRINNIEQDSVKYQIKLNTSFTYKAFNIPISLKIKQLENEEQIINTPINQKETIIFYKQVTSGKVKTIKLDERTLSFLLNIDKEKNLTALLTNFSINNNVTEQNIFKFLKLMSALEVIHIIDLSETE